MLKAATSASSSSLTTVVGPEGVTGTLASIAGEPATFTSEVTFTGDTSFVERGSISFGNEHTVAFSTVGVGHLAPSADPVLRHRVVSWRIDGGSGQFAGATGLITSNFLVDAQLGVVDHHFGVLFLP